VIVVAGTATEGRYMTKTRPRLRAIVVLIAGLLAVAVIWAGTALGGGSGGDSPKAPTPAQSDTGSSQHGERGADRDCPYKDRETSPADV
jgi:hypothetical protein